MARPRQQGACKVDEAASLYTWLAMSLKVCWTWIQVPVSCLVVASFRHISSRHWPVSVLQKFTSNMAEAHQEGATACAFISPQSSCILFCSPLEVGQGSKAIVYQHVSILQLLAVRALALMPCVLFWL